MTSKHNCSLTVTEPLNPQINNQPLFYVISEAYLFRSTESLLLSSDEQSAVSAPLPSRSGFMLLECSSNRQYHGKSHWLRGVLGRDARPLFRLEQSSLELKHFLTSDLRYSVQWLGSTPPTAPFFPVSSFIIANKVLIYFLCSFFSVFLFVIFLYWILPPSSGISPLFFFHSNPFTSHLPTSLPLSFSALFPLILIHFYFL